MSTAAEKDGQAHALHAVKTSAGRVALERAHLEEAIHRASEAGASLRRIAAAAGLNHETVRSMLRG